MNEAPQEQYIYTEKLLEIHMKEVKAANMDHSINHTNDWIQILNINLKLACQLEPDLIIQKIKANLKQDLYPLEAFLKICKKHEQVEACAILCKKMGQY